jgi:hypothetical protein
MSKETAFLNMGDLCAPKGSYDHILAVHEEAKAALNNATTSREEVQAWVGLLKENANFRQLRDARGYQFMLWEEFCTTPQPHGLGYDPEAIEAIIAERQSVEALAFRAEEEPLAEHRRPKKEEDKGNNITFMRGTSPDYLSRRIARDRPDILERMKAGEFRSVRAAALEAGIVKPTVSFELEPESASRALIRHFDAGQLRQIITELERALAQGE